jgi:hypothetical protein
VGFSSIGLDRAGNSLMGYHPFPFFLCFAREWINSPKKTRVNKFAKRKKRVNKFSKNPRERSFYSFLLNPCFFLLRIRSMFLQYSIVSPEDFSNWSDEFPIQFLWDSWFIIIYLFRSLFIDFARSHVCIKALSLQHW